MLKIKNHSGDKIVAPILLAGAGVQFDGLDILAKTLKHYGVAAGTEYGLLLRNGRVLCAIPRDREVALKVLSLYQPQRIRAKLLAASFRCAARLGLHSHFMRSWKTGGNATGSGVSPGVMVGSSGHQCERAVVVTREADGWVVTKIAFGPKGEAILGCEGKMLESLKGEFSAVPQLLSLEQSPDLTILRMRWQDGRAWQSASLAPLLTLLDSWANRGVARALAEYDEWQIIRPLLYQFPALEQRLTKLADQRFIPSIRHGDLTRPNLRVARDGQLQVHDWERGSIHGLPGLDLAHFLIQDRAFRTEDNPVLILTHVLKQLQTEPIASWLRSRGWNGLELELLALNFALNTATPCIDQRTLLERLSLMIPPPASLFDQPHAPREINRRATPNVHSLDLARPRVSVVTPSFKQVDFLKRCAASVQDQTGDFRVEHLIQDGGSGKEFDRWAAAQTTALCVSERDDGMYEAINRGFRKTSGDIIAWLNCDEQYLPGALQRVVRFFDEHPEIDILFGDVVLVDEMMAPLAYRRAVVPTLGHIRYSHLSTFSAATFVRRRSLDEGHYLQTRWKTIADAVWIEELLAAGYRPATLHEPLAVFCMLGSNLGQSTLLFQERHDWEQQLGTTSKWQKRWHVMNYRVARLRAGAYWIRRVAVSTYTQESKVRVEMVRRVSGQWSLARNKAAHLRAEREGTLGGLALRSRSTLSAALQTI
ncbi:MAG TPA: glycosyltransferase, partial [Luteolibacter sp.]